MASREGDSTRGLGCSWSSVQRPEYSDVLMSYIYITPLYIYIYRRCAPSFYPCSDCHPFGAVVKLFYFSLVSFIFIFLSKLDMNR